jgi:hypothetical protein
MIFSKMEDDPNSFKNGRHSPVYFSKIKDNLNFFKSGRQTQCFKKWKTISIFLEKERQSKHFGK